MVNTELVQLPLACVRGTRTCAGPAPPAAAGADVTVVVDSDATVLDVVGGTVVVVSEGFEDAAGGGGALEAPVDPPDARPEPCPMNIPATNAMPTAVSNCHVLKDRRSLMPSDPCCGPAVGPCSIGAG
jgi:hypothetical protein